MVRASHFECEGRQFEAGRPGRLLHATPSQGCEALQGVADQSNAKIVCQFAVAMPSSALSSRVRPRSALCSKAKSSFVYCRAKLFGVYHRQASDSKAKIVCLFSAASQSPAQSTDASLGLAQHTKAKTPFSFLAQQRAALLGKPIPCEAKP